jgi:hypothetical protein
MPNVCSPSGPRPSSVSFSSSSAPSIIRSSRRPIKPLVRNPGSTSVRGCYRLPTPLIAGWSHAGGSWRGVSRRDLTKILACPRTRFSVSCERLRCFADCIFGGAFPPTGRRAVLAAASVSKRFSDLRSVTVVLFHRSVFSPSGSPSMVAFVIILGYSRYVCRWRF